MGEFSSAVTFELPPEEQTAAATAGSTADRGHEAPSHLPFGHRPFGRRLLSRLRAALAIESGPLTPEALEGLAGGHTRLVAFAVQPHGLLHPTAATAPSPVHLLAACALADDSIAIFDLIRQTWCARSRPHPHPHPHPHR